MEKSPLDLTIREIIANPERIPIIVVAIAQHNYNLGVKVGYHKGRKDESEGKPWDQEIEKSL